MLEAEMEQAAERRWVTLTKQFLIDPECNATTNRRSSLDALLKCKEPAQLRDFLSKEDFSFQARTVRPNQQPSLRGSGLVELLENLVLPIARCCVQFQESESINVVESLPAGVNPSDLPHGDGVLSEDFAYDDVVPDQISATLEAHRVRSEIQELRRAFESCPQNQRLRAKLARAFETIESAVDDVFGAQVRQDELTAHVAASAAAALSEIGVSDKRSIYIYAAMLLEIAEFHTCVPSDDIDEARFQRISKALQRFRKRVRQQSETS